MMSGGSLSAVLAAPVWRRVRAGWPFVLLACAVVPLLWMAVSIAVRSDLFSTADLPNPGTFLTFVAATLGTVATVFGTLLSRRHNTRERQRLRLEAVIKNLESLPAEANKARLAGALSTMVLLGQHRVALRVLQPAWDDRLVDDATATWIIGQVLAGRESEDSETGDRVDDEAINEAAVLLLDREKRLTGKDAGRFCFPGYFLRHWLTRKALPTQAKLDLLLAIGQMLVYRGRKWWSATGNMPHWPTAVLLECAGKEPDVEVRSAAVAFLRALCDSFPDDRVSANAIEPVLSRFEDESQGATAPDEHLEIANRIRREWREPATGGKVVAVSA